MDSSLWETVHFGNNREITYETIFPSPQFLAFCKHHVQKYLLSQPESKISWLEYGCGGGVAAEYAAQLFTKINCFHLLDISSSAIEKSYGRLKKAQMQNPAEVTKHLISTANQSLPYCDGSIDIVNAEASLYYNSYVDFQSALLNIYRAMKPKGLGRFYIKADDSRYCIPQNEAGLHTYKINLPGHWEHGMTICCLPYDCVKRDFSLFSTVMIGKESMGYTDVDTQKSFWVVTVEK